MTVLLENERGEPLDDVIDPYDILHRLLPSSEDTSYQCLRFIDWYGSTTFNNLQMGVFLQDWERVRQKAVTEEDRIFWYAIRDLALICQKGELKYLKFYGD